MFAPLPLCGWPVWKSGVGYFREGLPRFGAFRDRVVVVSVVGMTTIAWDGRTLAADTLATWNGSREGYVVKIARRGAVMAAAAGNAVICRRLMDWFRDGMRGAPPSAGDKAAGNWSSLHIFTPGGQVVTWGPDGWEAVRASLYASGSGGDFALGAMTVGATAEEAVAAAILHDTGSGGDITVLTP